MSAQDSYDGEDFTNDMDSVREKLASAFEILAKGQFRDHMLATEENLDCPGLKLEWAGIINLVKHAINDFEAFQERAMNAG